MMVKNYFLDRSPEQVEERIQYMSKLIHSTLEPPLIPYKTEPETKSKKVDIEKKIKDYQRKKEKYNDDEEIINYSDEENDARTTH